MKFRLVNYSLPRLPGRWHFEFLTLWVNKHSLGLLILKRGFELVFNEGPRNA